MNDYAGGYAVGRMAGYVTGALLIGALLGLIPFFLARKRGVNGWGIAGLVCCTIGNLFGFGIIFTVVFVVIILIKS